MDFTDMPIEDRGTLFYEDFPEDRREKEEIEQGYVYFYSREYPEEGYYASMLMELALLDPLFWQALGRALGWNKDKMFEADGLTLITWRREWHKFIDHLAEGKDTESFFKELLNG